MVINHERLQYLPMNSRVIAIFTLCVIASFQVVFSTKTIYYLQEKNIRVEETDKVRYLRKYMDGVGHVILGKMDLENPNLIIDEYAQAIYTLSSMSPETGFTNETTNKNILALGLGTGALAKHHALLSEENRMSVIEPDKDIVDIAMDHFELKASDTYVRDYDSKTRNARSVEGTENIEHSNNIFRMNNIESGIQEMEDELFDTIVWDTVHLSDYLKANEAMLNSTNNNPKGGGGGHRRGVRSWMADLIKKIKVKGSFIIHMLGEMEPKLENSINYAFNAIGNGVKIIYKDAKRKIVAFSKSKEFNCNNFVLALKDWKSLARRNHPECVSYRG